MTQDTIPSIPSILKKIVDTKRLEVASAKAKKPLDVIKAEAKQQRDANDQPRRGFAKALMDKQAKNVPGIIAEVKKASPSKGIISPNFNPESIAQQYEQAGAACLSVLTDEQYFQGSNQYLIEAKQATSLPVLRKDFMIDAYQIYESYVLGADCILLIVACLNDQKLHELHQIVCDLGMDVLIEVHTQDELERALTLPDTEHNIYGINNRDLNTFNTDLQTSINLKQFIDNQSALNTDASDTKTKLLVTESGIHSAEDMQLMLSNQISCFLIGEQFMKTDNPGATLKHLLQSI